MEQLYTEWLEFARDDFESAEILLERKRFRNALYLAQQASEKGFKAYLFFKEQPLLKSHDLRKLLDLALVLDESFSEIKHPALELNGLDVSFRYPGESKYELESDYVQIAIEYAEQVLIFIESKCQ